MPAYEVDARSVILSIQNNLHDRYKTRFSILKEMIQNADDAGASTLVVDLRNGIEAAANPLLRGPGLLVVNDGLYSKRDESGIQHASASSKTEESGSAGRFGLGQKSVFHLCDAFIAVPFGHDDGLAPFVVNPYFGIEDSRGRTGDWEIITPDVALLSALIDRTAFPRNYLALWLPLRRRDLFPIEGMGFVERWFDDLASRHALIDEMNRPAELATILAATRNVDRIDLRRDGERETSLVRSGGRLCLLSSSDTKRAATTGTEHLFGGTIGLNTISGPQMVRFSGVETMSLNEALHEIKGNKDWPSTLTLQHKKVPEKAEPHGASLLVRGPTGTSCLTIDLGVFLPTGERPAQVIALDSEPEGAPPLALHLFLHGYFFVDSGRRSIQGLAEDGSDDDGRSGTPPVPARWNRALRDGLVLATLPRLFLQALEDEVVTPAEMGRLVRSLARSSWFRTHCKALGAQLILAERWNGRSPTWQVLPAATALRPVPSTLLSTSADLNGLLPELAAFAQRHAITICTADGDGAPRVLASEVPAWQTAELADLLNMVPPRVFKRAKGAKHLSELLDCIRAGQRPEEAIGAVLRHKLREAMALEGHFAPKEIIRAILKHVPAGTVVFLPEKATHSSILQALAEASVDVLVVGEDWQNDGTPSLLADRTQLAELLQAIEPLAVQERDATRAEQAASAAMALINASRATLAALASDRALQGIRLFPVTQQPEGVRRALSIADLARSAQEGTLFLATPATNAHLKVLLAALPALSLSTVPPADAELFRSVPGMENETGNLDAPRMIQFINAATQFGDVDARSALLEKIKSPWSQAYPHITAIRRLLVGVAEAGQLQAKVYTVGRPLEALVERLLLRDVSSFLAPAAALVDLTEKERTALNIIAMPHPELERRLQAALDANVLDVSAAEGRVLLEAGLSHDVLRRLPIHELEDGRCVAIDGTVCLASDRPIPAPLIRFLQRVRPAQSERAFAVQQILLPAHDAVADLRAALRALASGTVPPSTLQGVILDAFADLGEPALPRELREELRRHPWLSIENRPASPGDVLNLPNAVGEAARHALGRGGNLAFHPAASLPVDTREHRGFSRFEREILPTLEESFESLAIQIEELQLVGLPFTWDNSHRRDLATLARVGLDLKLPGWPLAAALVRDEALDSTLADLCLRVLKLPGRVEDMGAAMNALATAGGRGGTEGEAARRLYRAAFDQAARLDDAGRERLFTLTAVPTRDGGWRSGREVAPGGAGLASSCLLDSDFAKVLDRHEGRHADGTGGRTPAAAGAPKGRHADEAARDLDVQSAQSVADFLEGLRGRLPDDLALTLLALVGRFRAMREVMEQWRSSATLGIDDHLGKIDQLMNHHLTHVKLAGEVEQRRFWVERVEGDYGWAVALSGETFEAPLGATGALLVGNGHEKGRLARLPSGQAVVLHTLQLRFAVLENAATLEVIKQVRDLVRAIAEDCLNLYMHRQREAIEALPGMSGGTAQDLIEHTQAALREDLPTVLKQLKPKGDPVLRPLIQAYEAATDSRLALGAKLDGARAAAEQTLWDGLINSPEAQAALLGRVRKRIEEFGYDPGRVVFELFQNADDASRQLGDETTPMAFRLEGSEDRFDAVHWGRPINHRGADRDAGERKNYHRDLQNMLLMHVSDKPGGTDTTGKYGLGFKSVHALSREVCLASDLLAAQVVGGMLPTPWPDGPTEVGKHRRDGCPATLIRVPFEKDRANDGQRAIDRFIECAPYLPLFAKAVRRIEVENGTSTHTFERTARDEPLAGVAGVWLTAVEGSRPFRALLFDLERDFTLAIKLGETGPVPFEKAPRLWWTAPLDQEVGAGWMLNGPFALSPNRSTLADNPEAQQAEFRRLGEVLGRRLLALHKAAAADWPQLVATLGLHPLEAPQHRFFGRLWKLLRVDLYDDLARCLHGHDRGLGVLAAAAPVVPSELAAPFDTMLRAIDAEGVFGGALEDKALRKEIAGWNAMASRIGRIVGPETAEDLRRLGFGPMLPVTAERLLRDELGANQNRVLPEMAAQLGAVLTLSALSQWPLQQEGAQLRGLAKKAEFQNRNGAWCPVGDLTVPHHGTTGDELRARFAPPASVLSDAYDAAGVGFVLLARAEAGYNPRGEDLRGWAAQAPTDEAKAAVLRFLVDEDDKEDFLKAVRRDPPPWMQPLALLADGALTRDWTPDDRNKLRSKLNNYAPAHETLDLGFPMLQVSERAAADALEAIWDWWSGVRDEVIDRYDQQVYPQGFHPSTLRPSSSRSDLADREGWFTIFALSCFQGFGGTQDGQHRSFIESAMASGWWADLAKAQPSSNPDVWLARLRDWADDKHPDLTHWRWRRALIDLYKIARWLPQYAWIATKLPRAIGATSKGLVSLSDVLVPSYSPIWREAGLDAAPLVRTLGLGANWMIRELARHDLWTEHERTVVAPYGWASSARVRKLLNRRLGAGINDIASMDGSIAIWRFVSERLPHRKQELLRDGDLPLQLITRAEHEGALQSCLYGLPDEEDEEVWRSTDEGDDDMMDAAE